MPNATGTITTPHQVWGKLWQDNHSGVRRHKLMTKELGDTIPALGANENVEDYDDVLAPAKLFSPYSNWTWYVTEWGAPRPASASASSRGSRRSLATSTSTRWRRRPSSAASPPSSGTCTGSRRPSGR